MKRKLAGAAITMLVAGLAAGCGGDDDKDTTTGAATTTTAPGPPTKPLTKAAFIKRADVVCDAATKRIDAAGSKLQGSSKKKLSQTQIATFLKNSTVPAYEQMLVELRTLTPPKRDQRTIDGFVAELATAIDAIKANPDTYAKLTTANPFANANQQAKAYGMKVCGS